MDDEKKAAHRKWYLQTKYGMTPEQYDKEIAEGNCQICEGSEKLRMAKNKKLMCRKCDYLLQIVRRNRESIVLILVALGAKPPTPAKPKTEAPSLTGRERAAQKVAKLWGED